MRNYDAIDYNMYEVEDFILDSFFIEWVLNQSEEHRQFWSDWLLKNPHKREEVEQARKILLALEVKPHEQLSDAEVNEIINYLAESRRQTILPRIKLPFVSRYWINTAALILVFVIVGLLLFYKGSTIFTGNSRGLSKVVLQEQWNRTSHAMLIRLSDGTSAILKPGAKLSYPASFTGRFRDVNLEGEAFFEVRPNPDKAFLVHSNNMIVRVLGTSFTVRSQNKNQEFKVVVNTGKVAVYQRNNKNNPGIPNYQRVAMLMPNQQVSFRSKEMRIVKQILPKPLLLSKEVSVKKFNFYEAPLSDVIAMLKEAYGVDIDYDEKIMSTCTLTASLSDQPLYEKLELICKALGADFSIDEGIVSIHGNGCSALN